MPDWSKAVPYQIKSLAIKDACTAVREAKKKYQKTRQINRVKFRSRKKDRKIRSKTVRNMLSFAHYRFKEFLKHKAKETRKLVVDVIEAYTSQTVSWTGEMVNIGGSKIIKSKIDGQIMD